MIFVVKNGCRVPEAAVAPKVLDVAAQLMSKQGRKVARVYQLVNAMFSSRGSTK